MQRKRIETRWSDVDTYDHVNNEVYLTYLEEVRDAWYERTVAQVEGAGDFVLVRVAIDYRRELTLGDPAIIATCWPIRIGTSSVTTREEIWSESGDFLAAEAESVMVAHDAVARTSRPLTAGERAAIEAEIALADSGSDTGSAATVSD